MNILAPIWIGKIYQQLPCYEEYISPHRLEKTLSYIRQFDCDVYCLSEVEQASVNSMINLFGPEWSVIYTSHEDGFWEEWLEGKSWVSNGTCILFRKSCLRLMKAEEISFNDGCKATLLICEDRRTSLVISIVSLHFNTTEDKWIEAEYLLDILQEIDYDISIISGDFNFTDVSIFRDLGYIEAASGSQSTPLPQGRIDHTLVRGARHVEGYIHSVGEMNLEDSKREKIIEGVCATVLANGSDHYATTSVITLI